MICRTLRARGGGLTESDKTMSKLFNFEQSRKMSHIIIFLAMFAATTAISRDTHLGEIDYNVYNLTTTISDNMYICSSAGSLVTNPT